MSRGWTAVLFALSACATSPKAPVERAATPPAARNPPPECDPAHDDTIVQGVVVIRPGETLCIAVTSVGDVVVPARVVSTTEGSSRPIMLRTWREGSEVFMTIRNPFSRRLRYRAGIVPTGEVRPRDTKTCPALGDYRPTIEHWPRLVDAILLTDFRLLPEGATVVCE
jgi:hypothetical protein